MGRTAINGALYLGASQAVRLLVTILSTIVVSRLLAPDDYGVIAMAAPLIAFIVMFQDLGLSAATVQRPTISVEETNALFWINMLASAALAVGLLALAPLAGWFYHDVRAGYVTAASALTLLVSGAALQHNALLTRHLRFAALSAIDIANAVVGFLVAAVAALILHSYWALFLGALAGALVQTTVTWLVAPWRPTLRPGLANARGAACFGGHVTGFNLVNYFVRNADNVLIARVAGADMLGLYDRSYKLMMLPVQNLNAPLTRLLLPVMSRLQDDPVRYRRTFVFAIRMLMLATAPGVAVATVLSDRLMPFLLGGRWAAAGPIFFWLGLTGLVQPITNMTGVLFMSSGRTGLMARWGLFSAVVTLAGFAVGLRWGAVGVAASLFATALVRLPILFRLCASANGVRQSDLYAAQGEPLVGAGLGAAAALACAPWLSTGPLLCLAIPFAYVVTALASLATREGRRTMARALGLGRGLIGGLARRILARRRGPRVAGEA